MNGFLEYVPGNSLLHRMNPIAKLLASFIIIFACFITQSFALLIVILILDFVLAKTCGMMKQALGLAKVVAGFSLLLAILAILFTGADAAGDMLVGLPWGYIGTGSIIAAIRIILRLTACAVPLFLTFYVTKLNDMANALVKVCHIPYKYAFVFTETVHFIPVFMNDMSGIMEAQTARGVEFDGGIVKRVRLMVPLCVPLLVSSVRKTNSAAIAAEVRGFNLRTRSSGYKDYPFAAFDIAAIVITVVLLVLAFVPLPL